MCLCVRMCAACSCRSTRPSQPHLCVRTQLTLEGVCIVLGEKPDWDTARRVMGDTGFVKRMVEYDKDNISDKVVRSLKRIIDDPQFTHDQVRGALF